MTLLRSGNHGSIPAQPDRYLKKSTTQDCILNFASVLGACMGSLCMYCMGLLANRARVSE